MFEKRHTLFCAPVPGGWSATGRLSVSTSLSTRELQVISLIAEGWTDKEIARTLGLSLATVSALAAETRHKLHARSRAHAAVIATRRGLIASPDTPQN
jgi:DNA-binding NarL/FixJ family response regulator